MVIVCLGWGSLIWKPEPLPLASEWFTDGPLLPIEFARVGEGGELATALCLNAKPCRVLWAVLHAESLQTACSALRAREQIPEDRQDGIGVFMPGGTEIGVLGEWCALRQIDAVIWTALPPRFEGEEGLVPSAGDAIAYFQGLSGETLDHARAYFHRVPLQIDTAYRREIISAMGWFT